MLVELINDKLVKQETKSCDVLFDLTMYSFAVEDPADHMRGCLLEINPAGLPFKALPMQFRPPAV